MARELINRELSWLDFNRRVLALAAETGIPLLERLKFCAICSSNLDEFFQVRVAALKDQLAAGLQIPSADGLTPAQQLALIGPAVDEFVLAQEATVLDVLLPQLANAGVHLVRWEHLDADDRAALRTHFDKRIFPVLTPLDRKSVV